MRNRPTGFAVPTSARRHKGRRPRFDLLEPRQLLATFTVTNTTDSAVSGSNSLRDVLTRLQSSTDATNTIDFAITGGGPQYITPGTPLPAITKPVLIDGYSQTGARANALPQGSNATLIVEIQGTGLSASGVGFNVQAQGVTIQGLAMAGFAGAAISESAGAGNDVYQGDYFGTNQAGTQVVSNGNGIAINLTAIGSTVGGDVPSARNLISGSSLGGVVASGAGASGILVADNLIGTDASGLGYLRNPEGVIFTSGVTNSTIGGITLLAQNVIAGNNTGVSLSGAGTTGNLISGNYIGPNIAGQIGLANTTGIELTAPGNTVGGPSANYRNVISGNTAVGVLLDASVADANGSAVIGNYIGVNPIGSSAAGNAIGVQINGVNNATIGGAGGASNLISGNTNAGVQILGANASNNVIAGNLIGTDSTGTLSIPNAQFGVEISGGTGNTVGGAAATARNVISGNTQVGVQLDGGSLAQVLNNYIGTDLTGENALGNSLGGVVVEASSNTIGSNLISANSGSGVVVGATGITGNQIVSNIIGLDAVGESALPNTGAGVLITAGTATKIGGASAALRNVISANAQAGVSITGGALSTGTIVQGNYVGLDLAGSTGFGNGTKSTAGVVVVGTPNATIGGSQGTTGNVISGNPGYGVEVTGTGATAVLVQGNFIGTNAAGTAAIGNSVGGVLIDSINDVVGGAATGNGNLISGNTGDGVDATTTSTAGSGNLIEGNFIGTSGDGTQALANTGDGVKLTNTPGTTIGGTAVTARNVISGNSQAGILVLGASATGVTILGNYIGTNSAGSAAVPNVAGIDISGPNGVIGSLIAGGRNVISGNTGSGIVLDFALGNAGGHELIEGNYIGTNSTGAVALENHAGGIDILSPANTIGGTTAAARNVISGNLTGIEVGSGGPQLIQGNYIGTTATGLKALGNTGAGIVVDISLNEGLAGSTTIGGSTTGAGNVLSSNSSAGVLIQSSAVGNSLTQDVSIQGNLIGTGSDGTTALGNSTAGVDITKGSGNTIGGTAAVSGNTIANNGEGVIVVSGTNNAILSNTISDSTALGIDLGGTGKVLTNTPGGPHTGPNDLQNYPVLTQVLASATGTEVIGTFNSTPSTTFTLQFFSSPTANASGFGEGANYLGSVQVSTDASGNATFDDTLTSLVAAGQFISATATDPNHNTSEFSADVTAVNASTTLVISVASSPIAPLTNYYEGQAFTYTITVSNQGPNPATGVIVTDPLPGNTAYVSGTATTSQGTVTVVSGTLTALLGNLAVNGTATITFEVIPNFVSPPQLTDTATVVSNENTTPLDGTSSPITILPAVSLVVGLTQASSPTTSPSLDQTLTYTATVTNNGPSAATNVTLDDILPFLMSDDMTIPLVAFESATVSQGTYNTQFATDGVTVSEVDASFGTINSGFAAQLIITVETNNLGTIVDSATANSDVFNTNAANNTQTISAVVGPASDLVVSFDPTNPAVPNPALDGQPLVYTVDLTNEGPSDASNVTLTDLVPANATFVSASAVLDGLTYTYNSTTGTVTFPTLASGDQAVLTLTVKPTSLPTITDMASVPIASNDPVNGNNSASLTIDVSPTADLGVTVSGPPQNSTIYVGSTVVYVVTVTNFGLDQVNAVSASDFLPQGLELGSVGLSQGSSTTSGQTVSFDFGSLALNQSATATLTAVALPASAGPITDTATVADADTPLVFDPNLDNNSFSYDNTITGSADVGVTLSVSPSPALVGQPFTYVVTVTNNGPSEATNVVADDALDITTSNAAFTGVQLSQGSAAPNKSSVILNFGDIPSGETATATITALTSQATQELDNTVTVKANENDPNSVNNTTTTGVRVNPDAHLVVTGLSTPGAVLIGQDVTYTLTITNDNGPSSATDVTLFDTLPANSNFVSIVTPNGDPFGVSGNLVTVSLATLAVGQSAQVQITVQATAVGTIQNTANAIAVEANPFPADGTAVTSTTVNPSADVNVTLVGLPSTVLLGQSYTYTANVLNNGPSGATGVVMQDILPADIHVLSATATGGTVSIVNGVAYLTVGNLASGGLASLSLVVTPTAIGTIGNAVQVTSTGNDNNVANNTATAQVQVFPASDLAITAAASANPAPLHQNLIITLKVTNPGPSVATNVVLTDTLPAGAGFVLASSDASPGASYYPIGSILTIPIGNMAVGQTTTITLVITPALSGMLNNTATVSAEEANTTTGSSNVDLVIVAGVPGTLEFSAPTYSTGQNAGTATITVNRVGGSDGPVSVNYTTSNGTAEAGVDYTAQSGSLFFADGQTTASFTISLLNPTSILDTTTTTVKTVNLLLLNPAGGASLGTTGSAVLDIVQTSSSTGGGGTTPEDTAPQVTNLHRIGIHAQPTQLVLTFSTPLSASTAQNLANYSVVPAGGGGTIPILSATYNATNSTVTLLMATRLNVHKTYYLTVSTAVTGSTGIALASNYVAPVDFATLGLTKTKVAVKATHPVTQKVVKAKSVSHWASHLTNRMAHKK